MKNKNAIRDLRNALLSSAHPKNNTEKPQNIDAEQSVLGSLLIDGKALAVIRDTLCPDDFYIHRHGWIYEAICTLGDANKPIDQLTVADELERVGRLEDIGHYPYLTDLLSATPTSLHLEYYAEIVKEASTKRQLIGAAGEISKIAHNGASAEDAVQQSQALISGIANKNFTNKPQPVSVYASILQDNIAAIVDGGKKPGLPTGLTDLDRLTGGLRGGKLYLLAGRPGMGKSSLGLQMGTTNARHNKTVLYFSLEMVGVELVIRMISAETGIDGKEIEDGAFINNNYALFGAGRDVVSKWNILIDDKTRTIEGIRARSTLQAAAGLDLIIIDYIQRVQAGKGYDNRNAEVGAVSSMLKSLANDLDVPVVAISSLNRKCEERADKRPMLSDLRDSGDLEYDADVVLFLYRDEVYKPDTEFVNLAEISIAKQRSGGLGVVTTFFKKTTTQFADLETRRTQLNG